MPWRVCARFARQSAARRQCCIALQLCLLPHCVSSARDAAFALYRAMHCPISFPPAWHDACVTFGGRINGDPLRGTDYRFARQRARFGQRRPTHPVIRRDSQGAVFVW
ncbi:hypothetical protein WS68_00695 [Burkholderia sp. TSV86]|nr:hypothetical protein WS68_00695 [Burkholderia sp. TSV86]